MSLSLCLVSRMRAFLEDQTATLTDAVDLIGEVWPLLDDALAELRHHSTYGREPALPFVRKLCSRCGRKPYQCTQTLCGCGGTLVLASEI